MPLTFRGRSFVIVGVMKHLRPSPLVGAVLAAALLGTGCGAGVTPPLNGIDFGEIFIAQSAIEDSVALRSDGTKATLQSVAWAGGQAFSLVTVLPLEMDASAPYAITFAFQPPPQGYQTWNDTATFTVLEGNTTKTVEVSMTGIFTNGDIDEDGHVDEQYACGPGCDDCDDTDATVFPGAEEICDGQDNTCDGTAGALEVDEDADGYMLCEGDCNDNNFAQNPGLNETCDGVDTDCDGSLSTPEIDGDGDGITECAGDCEPTVSSVNPNATEICDGYDTDCSHAGQIPADELDLDNDTYMECNGDCDDTNFGANPGRPTELCDGFDTNCDGTSLPDEVDVDGDSWFPCNGDCDDGDPNRYPNNTEICDFIDNDCDGVIPANEVDLDGDLSPDCVDCDDTDASIYPGAPDVCDATLDNDCDGTTDPNETDGDNDAETPCDGDCDDVDPAVNTAATEICDGIDNDCSGQPLASETIDSDGDGIIDCDDTDCPIWVDQAYTGGASVGTVADPWLTIDEGIAAAGTGAVCPTVAVQPGTYTGLVDFGSADLRLVAEQGPAVTVLDGGGVGPVVVIAGGQTTATLLWGFTITGGESLLTDTTYMGHGGGVYIDASSPVLQANVITGNTARFHGGAVYAASSDLALYDNVFSGNVADFDGGAVYVTGNAGVFEGNTFSGNTAEDDAGALFLGEGSTTEIYWNVFANNTCTGVNHPNGNDGWGGAILNYTDSTTDIHNNLFVANVAEEAGGIFVYSSAPVVTNNTFFDNHGTGGDTGGLRIWQGEYRNNIVIGGTGAGVRILGAATTWAYNDVYDWSDLYFDDPNSSTDGDLTGTANNISVTALFVGATQDGDASNDVLSLQPYSLCVDAGSPAAAFTDADGTPNDLGAFGGPLGAWP